MKFNIKSIIIFSLFFTLVLSIVPICNIKSNAELQKSDFYSSYSKQSDLKAMYTVDGQSASSSSDGTDGSKIKNVMGTDYDISFTHSDNRKVSSDGIYTNATNIRSTSTISLFNSNFTIEIYIESFAKVGDNATIFRYGKSNSTVYFAIYVNSKNELVVKYTRNLKNSSGTDTIEHKIKDFELSDLQKSLISVSVNKSGRALNFYINGSLVKTISGDDTVNSYIKEQPVPDFVDFGDDGTWTSTQSFKCVRIYDKALTADQILNNYNLDYQLYHTELNVDNYYSLMPNLKAMFDVAGQAVGSNTLSNYIDSTKNGSFSNTGDIKEVGADGINLKNAYVTLDDFADTFNNTAFTVQMFIKELTLGTDNVSLFSLSNKNSTVLFKIELDKTNNKLVVYYNSAGHSHNSNIVTASPSPTADNNYDRISNFTGKLQNAMLTVCVNGNDSDVNGITSNTIKVYINTNCIFEVQYENDTNGINLISGVNTVKLFDSNNGASIKVKALRLYNTVLTSAQISTNFHLDANKYLGTSQKSTHSYGVTGLNKILQEYKNGSTASESNANLLNTHPELITKSYTEKVVYNNTNNVSNELLEDWDVPLNMPLSLTESKATFITNQAPAGDKKVRATFVDVGSSISKQVNNSSLRTASASTNKIWGRIDHALYYKTSNGSKLYPEYQNDEHNTALLLENSYYLRSKYKCGSGDVKLDESGNIDLINSTKLMATADICTGSLNDVDFCGMVIDYSDRYYNVYEPNTNYAGISWTGKDQFDPMYTQMSFDASTYNKKVKKTSSGESGSGTVGDAIGDAVCLFPTGIGFNLFRKNDTDTEKGWDENRGYTMRVFVGGTDTNTATYTDIDFQNAGLEKDLLQADYTGNNSDKYFHNFTIYREYAKWPYANSKISDSVTLVKDETLVYLVKFYVDKALVAVVAIQVENKTENGQTIYRVSGAAGIFLVTKNNGNYVLTLDYYDQNLTHYGYSKDYTAPNGKICTIGSWSMNNYYGDEGEDNIFNSPVSSVTGATFDQFKKIGTPSGNILFAVHKTNENMDGDEYDKIQWNPYTYSPNNYFWSLQNENDFCRIYVDNIGYMDYHDENKTIKSFVGQLNIKQSMTFNIDTKMVYTLPTEPKIMFNRLDYYSSNDMSHDSNPYDKDTETAKYYDWLASHGWAKLNDVANKQYSKLNQHYASVDGVYFKDLYDNITYKFTDFNGESMFTRNIRVYDYVCKVYENYENLKTEYLKETGHTNNDEIYIKYVNMQTVLRDLVDLCHAMQVYSGYINHSEEIPNIKYINSNNTEVTVEGINSDNIIKPTKNENWGTKDNRPSEYGVFKPKSFNDHDSTTNTIKSVNLSFKDYISIRYTIKFKNNNLNENVPKDNILILSSLTYRENKSTQFTTISGAFITDVDQINLYKSQYQYKMVSVVTDGDYTTIVIEVPIDCTNYNTRYKLEVYDDNERTKGAYQGLTFGIIDYCAYYWDGSKTSNTKLTELCKRIYQFGLSTNLDTGYVYNYYLE